MTDTKKTGCRFEHERSDPRQAAYAAKRREWVKAHGFPTDKLKPRG